ncbi:MAG: alpha/beta hydrolase [Ruminococcus sp.]|nr:alpha/beta hydrolase [Ruminococcus sp.]
MKLCILFPGIGYHCDKPLLYYTAMLAASKDYKVIKLQFSGFESADNAADHAYEQSEKQLSEINFHEYDKIVFVGKSIGTVACQRYRHEHEINALSILLTPLTETFKFPAHDCAAFHGTSDPLADTGAIVKLCNEKKVILHTYNNANHSLEVREAFTDLNTLSDVLTKINKLL